MYIMATGRVCSFSPSGVFLGHNKTEGIKELLDPFKGSSPFKTQQEFKAFRMSRSFGNLEEILMVNLKKKILTFSDILDLPPPDCSHSIQQLMMKTIKDLQNLYPEIVPGIQLSEMKEASINQVLDHFLRTLKSIKSSWTVHNDSIDIVELYMHGDMENSNTEQRVERAIGTLDSLIGIVREKFDIMDEDEKKDSTPRGSPLAKFDETCSDYNGSCLCGSPATPTSVFPVKRRSREFPSNPSYSSPLRISLRVQAVRKLNPIDVKRLSFHMPPHAAVQDFVASSRNNTIVDEIIEDAQVNKALAATVENTKEHYTETAKPKDLVTAAVAIPREPSSEPKLSPTVALVPSPPTTTPPSPDLRPHLTIPTPPPPPPPLMLKPDVTETQSMLRSPPTKLGAVPATTPPPLPPPGRSTVLVAPSAMPPLPPPTKLAVISTAPPPPLPPPGWSGTTPSAMPPPSPPTKSVAPPPPPRISGVVLTMPSAMSSPPPPPTKSAAPPPPPPSPRRLEIVLTTPSPRSLEIVLTTPLPPTKSAPPPPPPPERTRAVLIAPSTMPPPPPLTKSAAPSPPLPPPGRSEAILAAQSAMPLLPPPTKSTTPPLLPPPPGRSEAILAVPSAMPLLPSPTKSATPPPQLPLSGRSGSVLAAPSLMPPPSSPTKLAAISAMPPPPSPPPRGLEIISVAPSTMPPLPPPTKTAAVSIAPSPPSPPPMQAVNGAATPPPLPVGPIRSLRPKKATKLKRSSQMGNLYRLLKGKVEGNDLRKSSGVRRGVGGSGGGGKGMADALAEMTKRSAYFQKIEEDVQKYAKSITELKSLIGTFQTKDAAQLLKFQKQVESVLENLTDESQVLGRFEGFPSKRLETLRTATALHSKLEAMVTELQNWKIEAPLKQLLDKAERSFNKVKGEIEALERTKDEEIKKFQTHNIHFDFSIIIKIKELMVDVSSSCMELSLKESRKAKAEAANGNKCEQKAQECVKMLWRAFQFAFRVYTFAGGHDDRADNLTQELAHVIETIPSQNQYQTRSPSS